MSQADYPDAYLRLGPDEVDRLRPYGEERPVGSGEVLFEPGAVSYPFMVVLEGAVEIAQPSSEVIAAFGPGDFIGELNALTGERAFTRAQATADGRVLEITRQRLRDALGELPGVGDRVLRTLIARRSLLQGRAADAVQILGSRFQPAALRLREFAARNALPHTWVDVEDDPAAEALLRSVEADPACLPLVIFRDGTVQRAPSVEAFARHVGLRAPDPPRGTVYDLAVVGAGPGGLAAAVYGASEGLSTTVLESHAPGGQAGTSARIENYVGFPSGLSGADLAGRARVQAARFGATFAVPARAVGLAALGGRLRVDLEDGEPVEARAVVLATGAEYRRLSVPRLEEFEGNGVYYAATPLEARLCGRGEAVVVGGGNSAGQAVLYLAEHVGRVHLVVRGQDLGASMSRYLADRIERSGDVQVHLGSEVVALGGDGALRTVEVAHRPSGETRTLDARGLFLFIGARPATDWLRGSVALDVKGFVRVGEALRPPDGTTLWPLAARPPAPFETSLPGVYAVGDVRAGSVKRVASAVGEGSVTVSFVHAHLAE